MENLQNFGVQKLSAGELINIDGGRRLPSWKKIKKWGNWVWNAIGAADAVDSFVEGWNEEGGCGC